MSNPLTNLLDNKNNYFTITGNPTIDMALFFYFSSYIISYFGFLYNNIYEFFSCYLEGKWYIICEVDTPQIVEAILFKLNSLLQTDIYKVTFDNFDLKNNKYTIDKQIKTNTLNFIQFQNKFIYIIDEKNKLKLKILKSNLSNEVEIKKYLSDFIDHCKDLLDRNKKNNNNSKNRISYYEFNGVWKEKSKIPRRRAITVVGDACKKILKSVAEFDDNKSHFETFDIPYKIGFLLHGPPGTGKTTCIKTVASEFNKSIYKINLSSANITDDLLEKAFSSMPMNSILVIEDIDTCLLVDDTEQKNNINGFNNINKNKITYSSLLNILDGINSAYGNIIFVTTNHIDKLKNSLIRAGRIDKIEHFDYMTEKDIVEYVDLFYNEYEKELKEKLVNLILSRNMQLCVAELQNYFINNRVKIQDAIDNIFSLNNLENIKNGFKIKEDDKNQKNETDQNIFEINKIENLTENTLMKRLTDQNKIIINNNPTENNILTHFMMSDQKNKLNNNVINFKMHNSNEFDINDPMNYEIHDANNNFHIIS